VRVLAEHGDAGDAVTLHAALNNYIAEGSRCVAACAQAPDGAGVRRRLREIAEDPLFSQVHEAADARLRLLSGPHSTE
jgi:hypothetical protein